MEEILTEEYPEEYKAQVLDIVRRASTGCASLSNAEAAILFHWKRHENDPAYSFIPEEFRGYR